MRGLFRLRFASGAALLSTLLAIACLTSAFATLAQTFFPRLPFRDASQLVFLWECDLNGGTQGSSLENWQHWAQQRDLFEGVVAMRDGARDVQFDLSGAGDPQRVNGARVSADFFDVLGVRPQVGRSLSTGDTFAAVISDDLATRIFGGARAALNRVVFLEGQRHNVVGVLPPAFSFPYDERLWGGRQVKRIDAWLPLPPRASGDRLWREAAYRVAGRVRAGMSLDQARAILDSRWQSSELFRPASPSHACAIPFGEALSAHSGSAILVVFGCSLLLALLGAGNICFLLATRASEDRDTAIKVALGAGMGGATRRFVIEGLLLTLPAGLVSLLIVPPVLSVVRSFLSRTVPLALGIGTDFRVVTFAVLAATTSGLLSGLIVWPLLGRRRALWRNDTETGMETLRSNAGAVRLLLLATEAALCFLLAGLAFEVSLRLSEVRSTDLGFRTTGVRSFRVTLGARHGDVEKRLAFINELKIRLEQTGATVAASDGTPLRVRTPVRRFSVPGRENAPGQVTELRIVDTSFLVMYGIPLLQGRGFVTTDDAGAPWVVVVNERFRKTYLGTSNPLGEVLSIGNGEVATIVGVVADVSDVRATLKAAPTVYFNLEQAGRYRFSLPSDLYFSIISRTQVSWPSVRLALSEVDATLPLQDASSIEEDLAAESYDFAFVRSFLLAFFVIGLLLEVAGAYSVATAIVASKRPEFGVRLALGADPRAVTLPSRNVALRSQLAGITAALPALILASEGIAKWQGQPPHFQWWIVPVAAAPVLLACAASWFFASRSVCRVEPANLLRRPT